MGQAAREAHSLLRVRRGASSIRTEHRAHRASAPAGICSRLTRFFDRASAENRRPVSREPRGRSLRPAVHRAATACPSSSAATSRGICKAASLRRSRPEGVPGHRPRWHRALRSDRLLRRQPVRATTSTRAASSAASSASHDARSRAGLAHPVGSRTTSARLKRISGTTRCRSTCRARKR